MKTDAVILGAGPAGLSAAYALLKSGKQVVIIEKSPVAGGQMRSVKKGDLTVDFGYKHLYNRIPEVHDFWMQLLGKDFIQYKPRIGILFENKILEKEKEFKGITRGMPLGLLVTAFADLIKYRIKHSNKQPVSLQDYAHLKRGKTFTMIFTQGYDERVKGRKWSQLPPPKVQANGETSGRANFFMRFYKEAVVRRDTQDSWFHPAQGTGQIVEKLEQEIKQMGGKILLGSEIISVDKQGNNIASVTVKGESGMTTYQPETMISSLPIEAIARVMDIPFAPAANELSFKRSVLMVYLFMSEEVTFPYNSIQISSPEINMGRITNYAAYGGTMVPKGKGCICVEFFCFEDSPLFSITDDELYDIAVSECEKAALTSKTKCIDHLVFRSRGVDPATSYEDFITDPSRAAVFYELEKYANLYQISRTGIDRSTYTGLVAARAIVEGDKQKYASLTKPDVFAPWKQMPAASA
jgi:protoporphyrinogen oxidase